MLENILKRGSIVSLSALVVLLAIQVAPQFIERARANAPLEQQLDLMEPVESEPYHYEPEVTVSPKLFVEQPSPIQTDAEVAPSERSTSESTWNRRLSAAPPPAEEPVQPQRVLSKQRARNVRIAAAAPSGEAARKDVIVDAAAARQRLMETLREASARDVERQYDERAQDLAERHGGDRFDVVRGDLPERHQALMAQATGAQMARRYDSQDADLRTRHEALANPRPFARLEREKMGPHVEWFGNRYGDNENRSAEVLVERYYLVPVAPE